MHNKDLSYHGVSKITSKPDHRRTSQQPPQTGHPSLTAKDVSVHCIYTPTYQPRMLVCIVYPQAITSVYQAMFKYLQTL